MNNHTYDYIVVGSGPAGCVIAKKLSDDGKNSVLLLEAGENNNKDPQIINSAANISLPALYFAQYFWQGVTAPQTNVDNRKFEWTGGRLLGGGSSVNGEQYVRPSSAIFRKWEKYLGPIWSPEAATERFKELENYNGFTDNKKAHGFNGRLDVRQTPVKPTGMVKKIVSAIEQATGFKEILDYNNPDTPNGPFSRWQLTQRPNGERESAPRAFLSPDVADNKGLGVYGRRLTVMTKSTALRIIFHGRHARGVEFLHEGKCRYAFACKKVIVSAGSRSPKLMMLSGIGPAELLKELGIPVVVDNPNVGKNLYNHLIPTAVFSVNPNDNPLPPDDPNAVYTGGAFLPNPVSGNPAIRQLQFVPFVLNGTLLFGFAMNQPKSHGTVRIQANDPFKLELADYNYFSDPADMELAKSTFRIYIKNIAEKLSAIDPHYQLLAPAADILDDDARLEAYIRQTTIEAYHEMGTLRMAPSPEEGVVNCKGEIFGVKDLIVADDSIIPFPVDGNTQAPSYLIGLTIARLILGGSCHE